MTRKQPFRTGLITQENPHYRYPKPPFKGMSWHICFEKIKRHAGERIIRNNKEKEVIIYASNQLSAQKILDLILYSLELYHGDPISPFGDIKLTAYNNEYLRSYLKENTEFKLQRISLDGIPVACLIAAKASRRESLVYAIAKYRFSVSLYSQFRADLEPWSSPHLPVSKYPQDHIAFCHAIISAYSVLEELGLEIRASKDNPSKIDGQWNPKVKNNLENRLLKAGIDLSNTLLWTMRGPKRKLEKAKEILVFKKSPWSYGKVRDAEVDLIDAIEYARWLRSYVSSHTVKEITKVVSPYDVINTQHLARRCILEPFGIWHNFFKTLRID